MGDIEALVSHGADDNRWQEFETVVRNANRPRDAWPVWLLRDVAAVLAAAPADEDVHEWDGTTLDRRVHVAIPGVRAARRRRTVRLCLHNAKLHPLWDPGGRYRTHLRGIRSETMQRYPELWSLPVSWARRMERWVIGMEEADTDVRVLIAVVRRVVDVVVAQYPLRRRSRVETSALSV